MASRSLRSRALRRLPSATPTAPLKPPGCWRGFPPIRTPVTLRASCRPIRFRKGDASLCLFTTITTLGTAHDVTLQEIRIECFFPADAETAARMRTWA